MTKRELLRRIDRIRDESGMLAYELHKAQTEGLTPTSIEFGHIVGMIRAITMLGTDIHERVFGIDPTLVEWEDHAKDESNS